jgi:hypothetical protein
MRRDDCSGRETSSPRARDAKCRSTMTTIRIASSEGSGEKEPEPVRPRLLGQPLRPGGAEREHHLVSFRRADARDESTPERDRPGPNRSHDAAETPLRTCEGLVAGGEPPKRSGERRRKPPRRSAARIAAELSRRGVKTAWGGRRTLVRSALSWRGRECRLAYVGGTVNNALCTPKNSPSVTT